MLYVKKSLAGAILFPIFLGPIGLLYASFWLGLIVSIAVLLMAVVPNFRLGIPFLWVAGPYLSVFFVQKQAMKTNFVETREIKEPKEAKE